jgi:hypothetical protein
MSDRAPRWSGRAVIGGIAIIAGVLTALLTRLTPQGGGVGAYVVAALLVIAGVGLRIEAAILEARALDEAPASDAARAPDGS